MNSDKRLKLVKCLLKYVIEKHRQEEKFMKLLYENQDLFNIDISSSLYMPFYEIAEDLDIKNEESAEKIFNFLDRDDLSVDELVDRFCEEYNI